MSGVLKVLTSPLSLISKKLGATVSKIALTAISLANPVAGLVIAGVGLATSMLEKKPKSPQTSRESIDRLNASIDPRAFRKMVFGQTAMATDIRDQEYTNDQEYLHRFIVVAAHKVQSIDEIWFDDKKAWTAGGGAQGEYAGYLTVTPILEGNAGNAINISSRMGSTRRFTGCAYVHLRYKLTGNSKKTDSPFAQGIPTRMTIRGKGALVYDPRKDSTVPGGSGSHRANDQSTWTWDANASRNPALQKLWYLLGWRINGKLSVGRGIPPNRIDLESYAIGANLCDEAVTLAAGGTEPRYRSDGVFSEGDSPTTVLDNFKAAMNADVDDVGGRLRLTVFHNDLADPVAAFGDDDMIEPFKWSQTPSLVDSFNLVRGSYTDATDKSLYQMVDYPQVELASPDGIERPDSFDLALVQSPSQAQRLAKQRLQRQQYGGEFRTVWGARGWLVQKNSVVTQSCTVLGWTNKLFRVADMDHRVDGTCPVVLREENAEIYAWDKDERPAVDPADPTVYDYTKSPIFLGLDGAGKLFVQTVPPAADQSSGGDIWQDDDGRYWDRRGDNHLAIGGKRLMIGGKLLTITWTPNATQPVREGIDSALQTALNATAAAAQLAQDAQATADGKVQSFYSPTAPTAEGVGDLWFDTDGGNKQYRWSGSAWVAVQDTAIGDALDAANAADAKADGKVTTFISETTPTAEGAGDLWFKTSTGELRRWSGATWGNPLVDLTAAAQVIVIPAPTFTLYRTFDGVVKADQLPAALRPAVTKGGTDVRTDNSVSYSVTGTGGLAGKVSVDNTNGSALKGEVTLANTITGEGSFHLAVSVSGVPVGTYATLIQTVDDSPPIDNGGAGGTDSTLAGASSTSYSIMTGTHSGDPVMDVVIASGQTLKLNASFIYQHSPAYAAPSTAAMICKAECSSDNWATVIAMNSGASEVTGTPSEAGTPEYRTKGEMIAAFTRVGLAPGTYKVRLLGKMSVSSTGAIQVQTGSATSSKS